jgi:hypothetical protein
VAATSRPVPRSPPLPYASEGHTRPAKAHDATDPAEQRRIGAAIQRQALVDVPYIPLRQYFLITAYRRSLTGILKGPPLFWNVARA